MYRKILKMLLISGGLCGGLQASGDDGGLWFGVPRTSSRIHFNIGDGTIGLVRIYASPTTNSAISYISGVDLLEPDKTLKDSLRGGACNPANPTTVANDFGVMYGLSNLAGFNISEMMTDAYAGETMMLTGMVIESTPVGDVSSSNTSTISQLRLPTDTVDGVTPSYWVLSSAILSSDGNWIAGLGFMPAAKHYTPSVSRPLAIAASSSGTDDALAVAASSAPRLGGFFSDLLNIIVTAGDVAKFLIEATGDGPRRLRDSGVYVFPGAPDVDVVSLSGSNFQVNNSSGIHYALCTPDALQSVDIPAHSSQSISVGFITGYDSLLLKQVASPSPSVKSRISSPSSWGAARMFKASGVKATVLGAAGAILNYVGSRVQSGGATVRVQRQPTGGGVYSNCKR